MLVVLLHVLMKKNKFKKGNRTVRFSKSNSSLSPIHLIHLLMEKYCQNVLENELGALA